MLNEVRQILLNTPKSVDSRLESLKMVSTQDILNCLALISGFGADKCLEHKIGTIKTLRRLSTSTIGLKHAKDVVEVLAEACQEDYNAVDVLVRELNEVS